MKVFVHKGIELMVVLSIISDCELKIKMPSMFSGSPQYIGKINAEFEKYKYHKIVHKFKELQFGFGAISWGNVLDENYQLDQTRIAIKLSQEQKEFFDLLPEFAKEIGFDSFFKENQPFYKDICKEYNLFLVESNYENFMKCFYKNDCTLEDDRTFVLLPAIYQLGMCLQNGKVCCASVQEIDTNGKSHFVDKEAKQFKVASTAVHEFSHPIIDLLTKQYFENHERFVIDTSLTQSAGVYKNEQVINDTIIEAILSIYLEQKGAKEYKNKRISERKKVGFNLIEPLAEFIKEYTNNIEEYNSFSEFFPRVMNFLEEQVKIKDIETE